MAPLGSAHASAVAVLNRYLVRAAGERALVWAQSPVVIGDRSVPQPDLALLKHRADNYRMAHPRPADILLVVEVSETTLGLDLGTKVPLYAGAAIPEAWVVDLGAREVRVFRDPAPSGYRTSFTVGADGVLTAAMLPAVSFAVAELFPE
ncbi:MAG: Uma2 family endonuclease, partial [Burkholderiales bacterium]|nr:Uma2 family endonuclease [Burkholderiales bacterium]